MQPFKVFVPGRKVTLVTDGHKEELPLFHGENFIEERSTVLLLLRDPGTIKFDPIDAVKCGAITKQELVGLGYELLEDPEGELVLDKPDFPEKEKEAKKLTSVSADTSVLEDPDKGMPRFAQMDDEELKDECIRYKVIVRKKWQNDDIVGALKKAWRKAKNKKASK